jgi:O-antigen/teichoic acid export membrane protein
VFCYTTISFTTAGIILPTTRENTQEHEDKTNNQLVMIAVIVVIGTIVTILIMIGVFWKWRGKRDGNQVRASL